MSTQSELQSGNVRDADVQTVDAVVIGGGLAGLTAAWELTRAGLKPLLVEARGYTGGLVAGGRVAGVEMDLGAEAFVLRGTDTTEMVAELGLQVAAPQGGGAQLFLPPLSAGGGWELHPFPQNGFLGIPSRPLADDVVRVLGAEGAQRAARDAELGPNVGISDGTGADLAAFVQARMGSAVVERLVRPIVAGIHTSDPKFLDADTVAPGLRETTARLGSLAAAVAERRERAARTVADRGLPRAVDVTTEGGLFKLTRALVTAIETAGGQVLTRTGAQWLRPVAASGSAAGWEVAIASTTRGATPSAEPVADGPVRVLQTRRVVVACSARPALRLLADAPGVDTDVEVPVGSPIARFTLVARAAGLAGSPVGSGLLVAPSSAADLVDCPVRAKALSHLNVKWPWVGEQARALHGEDVQVLRLSYGRPGQAYPQVDVPTALADVEALTGVRIAPAEVLDSLLVRWDGTLPPVTPAYRARTDRLLAQVEDLGRTQPGLRVAGAWVAGTGIAAVVSQARQVAREIARG